MSLYCWFCGIIACHFMLLIGGGLVHAQDQQTDTKSIQIHDMSEVVRQLTTHQDPSNQQKEKKSATVNQGGKKKEKLGDNIIKTNKRLTRKKPQDGVHEKVQLINLTQRKVTRLKRQLTTHQAKGKTVYVKKEVVTKINRLHQEGINNVDVVDTGVVSLAVAEGGLMEDDSEQISVTKDEDTTDNTLATFAVGSPNTSANHIYRITKDGKYQYQDGKEIIGSEKYNNWFKNGYKPITETTFYYEIAQQPHIDLKKENVKSFTSMNIEEQVTLIKKSIQRSTDYVELDKLARTKTSVLGNGERN